MTEINKAIRKDSIRLNSRREKFNTNFVHDIEESICSVFESDVYEVINEDLDKLFKIRRTAVDYEKFNKTYFHGKKKK